MKDKLKRIKEIEELLSDWEFLGNHCTDKQWEELDREHTKLLLEIEGEDHERVH